MGLSVTHSAGNYGAPMKKLVIIALSLILIGSSIFGSELYPIFQKTYLDASHFIDIDPVTDDNGIFSGLIITDDSLNAIIIDLQHNSFMDTVYLPRQPIKTIIRESLDNDSLFLYCLLQSSGTSLKLAFIQIINRNVSLSTLDVPIYLLYPSFNQILDIDIAFLNDELGHLNRIAINGTFLYEGYLSTMGPFKETNGTTIHYDLTLENILFKKRSNNCLIGNLTTRNASDSILYSNYYYSYDFRDFDDQDNYGEWASSNVKIVTETNETSYIRDFQFNTIDRIWLDDIEGNSSNQELLINTYAYDNLLNSSVLLYTLEVYSFQSGKPELLWEVNDPDINYSYYHKPFHAIVGSNGSALYLLEATTGQLREQFIFNDSISVFSYFTMDISKSSLGVVGKKGTTLLVYQLGMATDVISQNSQNVHDGPEPAESV